MVLHYDTKFPRAEHSGISQFSSSKMTWEKVLYKKQPFPDNYVGPHFLSELRKNLYVRKYHLHRLIIDAGGIYQQLCCICTFVVVYFHLLLDSISPGRVCGLLAAVTFICYLVFLSVRQQIGQCWEKVLFELRTGLIIAIFTFLLAPILHSLLATVSTDTIYATTIAFLLLNWVLLDYHCYYYYGHGRRSTVLAPTRRSSDGSSPWFGGSNTSAFSCSLLAALCLASGLSTPGHTFALLSVGTGVFALWPSLIGAIRVVFGRRGQLALTVVSYLITNTLIWPIAFHQCSRVYQYLIGVAVVFATVSLNFFGPWLLIRMQKMKG